MAVDNLTDALNETELKELTDILRQTGSNKQEEAVNAQTVMAAAIETPLKQGILTGDIVADIFRRDTFDPGVAANYPIDLYRPDNAGEFTAYVIPNQGRIPERKVEGDYVNVPTFDVGGSIDFLLKYARDARWDIVSRSLEVLEAGFVKKRNNDGFHVLLKAALDRNIIVSDANASAGQFTKRLLSNLQLAMRRNAGGNSTSINRGRLTHLYVSPEALADVRNWGVSEVDEITRREIYVASDNTYNKIFGVTLVDLDELGEDTEYQDFYTDVLGGAMVGNDVEIAVGLDLSKNDSFVMPVTEDLQVFPDPTLHRQRRQGYYAWANWGFAVLNPVRVLLASL